MTTTPTVKINYCYVSTCINLQVEGEFGDYYCAEHMADYNADCTCRGCAHDRVRIATWDRTKPHCREEACSDKVFVTHLFTGGHTQCSQELVDGVCPNARNHLSELIALLAKQTECIPGVNHLASCRC